MQLPDCTYYQLPPAQSEAVWRRLGESEVFVTKKDGTPFTFATGQRATLKAEAEQLWRHESAVKELLGIFAVHPCVVRADTLSFVPNGMADFAEALHKKTGKPLVRLVRPDGASRSGIRFLTDSDRQRAGEAVLLCAVEDISRTGFSTHTTGRLLRSVNPSLQIHSLSILQREPVSQAYVKGSEAVVYHTLVRRDIPLEAQAFRAQYPGIPVTELG